MNIDDAFTSLPCRNRSIEIAALWAWALAQMMFSVLFGTEGTLVGVAKWHMGVDASVTLGEQLSSVMSGARIENLTRLSGGASRETWMFTADGEKMVLQRQRDGATRGMSIEASVLRAAHAAGVAVPELIVDGGEPQDNFFLAARNIPQIDILPVQGINVYDILRRETLVLTKAAVDALEARFK